MKTKLDFGSNERIDLSSLKTLGRCGLLTAIFGLFIAKY